MAEVNKKLTREIMSRIRRRSLALSVISRELFVRRLSDEVKRGAVLPEQIEAWSPVELAKTG